MDTDQMERLEAQVQRAVETIGLLRGEREDLRKQCRDLEETAKQQKVEIDSLKSKVDELSTTDEQRREEIRRKVASMLEQLDAIKIEEHEFNKEVQHLG